MLGKISVRPRFFLFAGYICTFLAVVPKRGRKWRHFECFLRKSGSGSLFCAL